MLWSCIQHPDLSSLYVYSKLLFRRVTSQDQPIFPDASPSNCRVTQTYPSEPIDWNCEASTCTLNSCKFLIWANSVNVILCRCRFLGRLSMSIGLCWFPWSTLPSILSDRPGRYAIACTSIAFSFVLECFLYETDKMPVLVSWSRDVLEQSCPGFSNYSGTLSHIIVVTHGLWDLMTTRSRLPPSVLKLTWLEDSICFLLLIIQSSKLMHVNMYSMIYVAQRVW